MHKLNYKILGFLNRFKGSSSLVKGVNILLLLLLAFCWVFLLFFSILDGFEQNATP